MEAFTRFRYLTKISKFFDVKQTRSFCEVKIPREIELCDPLSQILDFQGVFQKYLSMKNEEMVYKKLLLDELVSECSKDNFDLKESMSKKMSYLQAPINFTLQQTGWYSSIDNFTDELLTYLEPFQFDRSEIHHKEKTGKINMIFIRNTIEKEYLAWKFQVSAEIIKHICGGLNSCFYKYRSLRNLKKTSSLLETVPEIEKQSVALKIYHITQNPFNLDDVINFKEKVAGISWHSFSYHCPKIFKFSHQQILFRVSILEALNFTEEQIQKGFPFLNMTFTNFIKKLNHLLGIPNLEKYRNEPEFLQLLHFENSKLIDLLNSYKTSYQELLQFVKVEKTPKILLKKYLRYLISVHYEVDNQVIKGFSLRNLKYVPEMQITESLNYLKESGFTSKEIEESLGIIFYPRFLIERTLEEIKNDESLKKIAFSNDYETESNFFTKGTKEKRKLLQLCLYYMEKPFNFSGNGVFLTKEAEAELEKTERHNQ